MATQEQIDMVTEAQEQISKAVKTLKMLARELHDEHAQASLIAHLEIMTGNDHNYLSRDFNLIEWIHELEGKMEEVQA